MKLSTLFKGKKVRLAAIHPDDYEVMARWTDNDEYMRLLDAIPARPMSPEKLKAYEKDYVEGDNNFVFRLRTLTDDRLVGFVSLEVMWNNQSAFLAIGIGDPQDQGKGYGTEGMYLILKYGFQELGLHRIGLNVFSYNERAIHLYEKLGFVQEGRQRECLYRDGRRFDMVFFGMLREEWLKSYAST